VQITGIRAEQTRTKTDAIMEGMLEYEGWETKDYKKAVAAGTKPPLGFSPRERFFHLWDKLNKRRGYSVEVNPWVIVYTFKKDDI
jgi:hypothetical protein